MNLVFTFYFIISIFIISNKLHYFGITGPYNSLLKSYLTKRTIYTYVNGVKSECKNINYGVPQGSILGPILFSLYINDLKNISQSNEIILFADDTSIFCTADNYTDLEQNAKHILENCNKWLQSNRLTLNIEKTHYLIFSKTRNNININLTINSRPIYRKHSTRYLGLTIQENLKWDLHIKNVINKMNKQIPLYLSLRSMLPINKKSIIYRSITLSIINYAIELYGKKNTIWLKQLQKTQNRLLKILFQKHKLSRTEPLHKALEILKIHDLSKVRLSLIPHKVTHYNTTLNHTHAAFTLIRTVHNRQTRNQELNFYINANASDYTNKITEESSIIWNNLITEHKQIPNRNMFKEKLNKLYLSNYSN